MKISNRRETFTLFVGDLVIFVLSLWLMLYFRNLKIPSSEAFYNQLAPFSLIFVVSIVTFFIAGLYEKHTVISKSRLPHTIFRAEIINSVIAIMFFYFVPYFGIAPKTTLFIYVLVSFALIVVWRIYLYKFVAHSKVENALIVGSGKEMMELAEEINKNGNYGLCFVQTINLEEGTGLDIEINIKGLIEKEGVSIVVIDLEHDKVQAILPSMYRLIFSNVRFVAMYKVYEDVFKRVPFSVLQYNWFLENISASPKLVYDFMKRLMDIFISILCAPIVIPICVMAALVIKINDGGVIFGHQKRVGQGNNIIDLLKFRTMDFNDNGDWKEQGKINKITRVGHFLRKSRIDELPQFWNVFKGDVSLIGPRPEFPDPVKHYAEEIPYYNVRHIIKPGLSGWAQLYGEHPHHGIDLNATGNKLSYDLYYIKNRSFILDLKIALKTIKKLLSIAGV